MPWAEPSVKDQKLLFVADCLREEEPMTVLCERYGISRDRGYVLKRRFLLEGPSGLEERSRAPLRHGHETPAALVVRLIEARKRWPHWGPKKLLAKLSQEAPQIAWPSASTGSEILRREGLSQPRRRRRRPLTVEQPFGAVAAANDAWCIDFKGWFRTGDGRRCDPLTVTDAFSRYLLAVQAIEPVTQAVQAKMDGLFAEHGLPAAIRSDNGPPFALDRRGRPDQAVGPMGQDGHPARADMAGQAATERPSRTHARHAQARGMPATVGHRCPPAGPLRRLPQGVQP